MSDADFFALVDESGRFSDPNDPTIVIAVVVAPESERGLGRLLGKIRRQLPRKGPRKHERRRMELKFNTTSPHTRRQVLSALGQQPVSLFILLTDKRGVSIRDTPENYGLMVSAILLDCIEWFPSLDRVLIDRRFHENQTKPH